MLSPKQVELLFEDRVRFNGGLPIRFQDVKDANGSWLQSNPSDYVVVYERGSVFCEVKSFKGRTFPFSNIKSSQFAWAAQIHRLGQPYLFYLFQKETKTWYLVPSFIVIRAVKEGLRSFDLATLEKFKQE
jgi:penicillin-binding protein-related factor A (putative recombinase)